MSRKNIEMGAGAQGGAGNEQADEEAKAAAEGFTGEEWFMPIECRGVLPASRVAERQKHNKVLRKEEKALFAKSPRAVSMLNVDPSMPSAAS